MSNERKQVVTPEVAAEWLSLNHVNNRRVSSQRVASMARAMLEGRWEYDGSPIKFSETGELVDGQHRLSAVVRSGVSVEFAVVEGVSPQAFLTMDTGKPRNLQDSLMITHGDFPNRGEVATIINAAVRWAHGGRGPNITSGLSVSNREGVDLYESNADLLSNAATLTRHVYGRIHGPSRQILGLCAWLFLQISADDAEFFYDRLASGVGLSDGHPILALRNAIIADVGKPARDRRAAWTWAALIIKTWNAYRSGESIRQLKFNPGGSSPERFPEPL